MSEILSNIKEKEKVVKTKAPDVNNHDNIELKAKGCNC